MREALVGNMLETYMRLYYDPEELEKLNTNKERIKQLIGSCLKIGLDYKACVLSNSILGRSEKYKLKYEKD